MTGRFLKSAIPHPLRGMRRPLAGKCAPTEWVRLKKASLRNLQGFDVEFPVGRLTVVCGVSGAGKSTLVTDLLAPAIRAALAKKKDGLAGKDALTVVSDHGKPAFASLSGLKGFRQLVVVDQEPIGKTPRSTPRLMWAPGTSSANGWPRCPRPRSGAMARASSPSTLPAGGARPARARGGSNWR